MKGILASVGMGAFLYDSDMQYLLLLGEACFWLKEQSNVRLLYLLKCDDTALSTSLQYMLLVSLGFTASHCPPQM